MSPAKLDKRTIKLSFRTNPENEVPTFSNGLESSRLNAGMILEHPSHVVLAVLGCPVSIMAIEYCKARIVSFRFKVLLDQKLNIEKQTTISNCDKTFNCSDATRLLSLNEQDLTPLKTNTRQP